MCGIFYSNKTRPSRDHLRVLRRRGPDGFSDAQRNGEYFAHALLNTMGETTPQPLETDHGVLIYNGDTYNHVGSDTDNDSRWISQNLDDTLDRCLELIRSLRGQYALCYSTDQHVVFSVDQWRTRNLFYYYSQQDRTLSVCSHSNVLRDLHGAAWPCEENSIYILDRTTFRLRKETTSEWDFTQTVPQLDHVFNEFETAVRLRWRPESVLMLSSGIDAGALACSMEKQGMDFLSVSDPSGEDNPTMWERINRHKSHVNTRESLPEGDQEQLCHINNDARMSGTSQNNRKMRGFAKYADSKNCRILIAGEGSDEIYADYGHAGKKFRSRSRFGGVFHDNLSLLWPWHNSMDSLYTILGRADTLYGYYGKELRLPYLDQRLVQTWLNTTVDLKNKGYKHWLVEYMKQNDYPYHLDKVGLSGRRWN